MKTDFRLNEEYKRVKCLGDSESLIDWEAFRQSWVRCITSGAISSYIVLANAARFSFGKSKHHL
jgi:hypothetical protein